MPVLIHDMSSILSNRLSNAEVHYFDNHFNLGQEWYRSKMPLTTINQLTMEKTASYFHASGVPERIHAMNTSIKLILVCREPVNRAMSEYIQFSENYPLFQYIAPNFEVNQIVGIYDCVYDSIRRHCPSYTCHFAMAHESIAGNPRRVDRFRLYHKHLIAGMV